MLSEQLIPLIKEWWLRILPAVIALQCVSTVHIVMRKRDSRAAIGWVGLVWLAPVIGSFFFYCFGVNRIQRKAFSLQLQESWQHRREHELTPDDVERGTELARKYPNLVGLATHGRNLVGRQLVPGNKVTPLVDGDEAYPAMLASIEGARQSIALMSYIFDSDRAGDKFLQALVEARDRGVEVRVLIDGVGSRYSKPNMVGRLVKAGIKTAAFLPSRVPWLLKYANLRNHRKILVVDGKTAFTGGTNIREGHWLSLDPGFPVQCLHFQLEGPIVEQLQEMFALDWAFASGESLRGKLWFPEINPGGHVWARGIPDGPDEDFEKLKDTMLAALATARNTVRIVTPYFLPESVLIHGLSVAALRGVDLRIYLPEKNNLKVVSWACNAELWQILEKNCRVFTTPPPFDHTKLMVVDGLWSLIGSTNWDPRSLRLNFEFNVECYDEELAESLTAVIDEKESRAHEITLDEMNNRSFPIKLRDGLARLMTPYL